MSKVMAWSYSRLDCFEKCPKKFQGLYVTKEFAQPDFEAFHLKRGKMIHKALEAFLKSGDWDYLDPEKTTLLTYEGKSVLKAPLNFLFPLLTKLRESLELDVEGDKALDANLNPVSWFDSDNERRGLAPVWMRCIIDVFAMTTPQSAVMIDWKSGKVFQKVDQLRLCAGVGFALKPELQEILTAYFWLDHPTAKPLIARYTRNDFDDIWQEFGDRAELIQLALESGQWLAQPSKFNCTYCEASTTQCEHKEG